MAIETNMEDCGIRNRLDFLGFTLTDNGPQRSFESSVWKPVGEFPHWPSEHTVDGKQYLMEGHLVHMDAQGGLAVLGVLMERGETNPALEAVWEFMPPTAGAVREPGVSFNVNDLLPGDRTTYRYPGSLTTPPCSESVQWMVLKNAMTVSAEQAHVFEDIIGYNSRYTQPLHGREILEDISVNQAHASTD